MHQLYWKEQERSLRQEARIYYWDRKTNQQFDYTSETDRQNIKKEGVVGNSIKIDIKVKAADPIKKCEILKLFEVKHAITV